MKVLFPKWQKRRPHLGWLVEAVTAWICTEGLGFYTCVWHRGGWAVSGSQPAVLSCGSSGDSPENGRAKKILFSLFNVLWPDIKAFLLHVKHMLLRLHRSDWASLFNKCECRCPIRLECKKLLEMRSQDEEPSQKKRKRGAAEWRDSLLLSLLRDVIAH